MQPSPEHKTERAVEREAEREYGTVDQPDEETPDTGAKDPNKPDPPHVPTQSEREGR